MANFNRWRKFANPREWNFSVCRCIKVKVCGRQKCQNNSVFVLFWHGWCVEEWNFIGIALAYIISITWFSIKIPRKLTRLEIEWRLVAHELPSTTIFKDRSECDGSNGLVEVFHALAIQNASAPLGIPLCSHNELWPHIQSSTCCLHSMKYASIKMVINFQMHFVNKQSSMRTTTCFHFQPQLPN